MVYLLAGITLFNFISEATNNALISITGNAPLITKVYLPMYIFPIAKVISSSINLFLSMIPMLLMVVITGSPINLYTPLIFINLLLALVFCIGLGFVLATLMTLFRDTQFLWSIVLLIWMYATPIFYPVSIIPAKYAFIYMLNPLYHFISAARTILLSGVAPSLQSYLILICISFGSFALGWLFFVKNQDRFIHHL
jgi:ABC-2 type transport system permease protein